MIKNLNENELRNRIHLASEGKIFLIKMYMPNTTKEEWINTKKFANLKKEIQIYNNIEFGCMKTEDGCIYYFFCANKDAINRIVKFMSYIAEHDKYTSLTSVPKDYENKYNNNLSREGLEYNACPLF